jgi:integration host factor subunit beta
MMTPDKCTKAEIVDMVYEKSGMNRADIKRTVDTTFDAIKEALRDNRTVELRGFGTFEVRFRKGRSGARNPRTGEFVTAHPHGIVAFRPGKEIKRDVWLNGQTDAEAGPAPDENGI